jgi:hypothetical protein
LKEIVDIHAIQAFYCLPNSQVNEHGKKMFPAEVKASFGKYSSKFFEILETSS